jgi:hypothetical protein
MSKAPSLSGQTLAEAKYQEMLARKRLQNTAGALQYRLKPGTIMHNAWEGVRDKGSEVADRGVHAAQDRPVTIAGVIAAVLIFFAREPLLRFVGSLFGAKKDETVVTADLKQHDKDFDLTAPVMERTKHEGVSA